MLSDRSWNTTKQSEYSQLEAKVTGHNNDKTALIAGLTTGIVVICMIITTFGLFVLYHHRHRTKKQQQQEEQMDFVMEPITPVTAAHLPPEQVSINREREGYIKPLIKYLLGGVPV